jgi:hypothetical protein
VPAALLAASRLGLMAVALTMALMAVPTSLMSTRHVCLSYRIRAREVLAQLVPGTAVAALLALVLVPVTAATGGLAPILQLAIGLAVGCAVFVLAVGRVEPRLVTSLGPQWSRRLGPFLPAAAAHGEAER